MRSLREYHILTITDLDTLPADYPIPNVITVSEVITLPINLDFSKLSGSLGSKGVPDIISCLAFYINYRILATSIK